MNNRPPLQDSFDPLSNGWSAWFNQVFLCLSGWLSSITKTATIDFPSIGGNAQAVSVVTVTGVKVGDLVTVQAAAPVNGIIFTGDVTSANTVTVRACNFTTGAIDPPSLSFRIIVIQN